MSGCTWRLRWGGYCGQPWTWAIERDGDAAATACDEHVFVMAEAIRQQGLNPKPIRVQG